MKIREKIANLFRISAIEKQIFEVKNEMFGLPQKLKNPYVNQGTLDKMVEKAKKPLLHQLDLLETERSFLISQRESWLPKTIWNLLIPILVSVITAIIVTKLQIN